MKTKLFNGTVQTMELTPISAGFDSSNGQITVVVTGPSGAAGTLTMQRSEFEMIATAAELAPKPVIVGGAQ